MWSVDFYRAVSGRCPVEEYFDKLSNEEFGKVSYDLELLKTFGINLRAPHVRSLGKKLWELRTTGGKQHRVIYFAFLDRRLVLLHAFLKKTQKTPPKEIEIALKRMKDYLERVNK